MMGTRCISISVSITVRTRKTRWLFVFFEKKCDSAREGCNSASARQIIESISCNTIE